VAQIPFQLQAGPGRTDRLGYLLHVPPWPTPDRPAGWPLILFLHGSLERGEDLDLVKRQGLPRLLAHDEGFPFVVVSPQCPTGGGWYRRSRALVRLLDQVIATQRVDPARIYLTGISMGGYGTWGLAAQRPERFAAIAPICGGGLRSQGFPAKIRALRGVPVWAFHGLLDDAVPCAESEQLVAALRAEGGDVRFTLYPDLGHDSWTRTYDNPALWGWMLSHRLPAAGR
jgi:predicted peptidase